MQEIWKDIEGFNGKYQVSNTGKVKSFAIKKEGQILKPQVTRGYAYVGLCRDSKRQKNHLIHRIVASAFAPNPNGYKEVNHKDEDKLNNNADNLEWCTREYNMSYKNARIRQGVSQGKPVLQFTMDNLPIAKYYSAEFAGKINNIDSSSIIKCCIGKRSFAGGYKWKYE